VRRYGGSRAFPGTTITGETSHNDHREDVVLTPARCPIAGRVALPARFSLGSPFEPPDPSDPAFPATHAT